MTPLVLPLIVHVVVIVESAQYVYLNNTSTMCILVCSQNIVITMVISVISMGCEQIFTSFHQGHQQVFMLVIEVIPMIHKLSQKSSLGCKWSSDRKNWNVKSISPKTSTWQNCLSCRALILRTILGAVCEDVCWVLWWIGITWQLTGMTGSYAYWHLDLNKEKCLEIDLERLVTFY